MADTTSEEKSFIGSTNHNTGKDSTGESKREKWARNVDFLFSLVGFVVGLGNVWRFPYLCYKNGGGAFLVPYIICCALIAVPISFMEIALGQYTSLGGISAWDICPLFKGIGYGSIAVVSLCNVYYNIIIAWAFYYLFASFTTILPWSHCNNTWNTETCITSLHEVILKQNSSDFRDNGSNVSSIHAYFTSMSASLIRNNSVSGWTNYSERNVSIFTDPVTEFWTHKVLKASSGIEDVGTLKWDLAGCLLLAWFVVYLCICKGVKSSGKVMYFTATSPYIFMLILLIRGVTLPGSLEGIKFYIIPDWVRLKNPEVWIEAGMQTIYTYSIGIGVLTTLGSFNKFHHNCYRDSLLFPLVNSVTSFLAGFVIFSMLGFMAHQLGASVSEVAQSGPGLAFIVYPQAIAQMPIAPLWSALFFIMLLLLGLDGQIVAVEGLVMSVLDEMPSVIRRGKRKGFFIASACCVYYLLGLCMVTNGGIFVFQMFDHYIVRMLLINMALSCIVISYIYGADKFYDNIRVMLGFSITPFMKICWMTCSPLLCTILQVINLYRYSHVTYNRTYHYPKWSLFLGWMLASASFVPIPIVMIVKLIKAEGSLQKRLHVLLWPNTPNHRQKAKNEEERTELDPRHAQDVEYSPHSADGTQSHV